MESGGRMRVAFADLNFSWPPNGGADVDLLHTVREVQAAGEEVHLFVAHEHGSTERGRVAPESLPFPCTRLDFDARALRPDAVGNVFRQAIDAFRPDVVFLAHGYALKPHLTLALRGYPLLSRFYAHELTCSRDGCRFKAGAPCPNDYLRIPDLCRACALEAQRAGIVTGEGRAWTTDYLAARAFAPEYHALVRESLATCSALVVYNTTLAALLRKKHGNVRVIPGGVDASAIPCRPPANQAANGTKVILMTGRAEAPQKGLEVLREACALLRRERGDFEIWATHFDRTLTTEGFRALGWLSHEETIRLYEHSDIGVVPSLWEEPFGLAALEAMAAMRPVCASRTGGLQDLVRHGETGLLVEPGNAPALAEALRTLLDDSVLRVRMGQAGRRIAEAEYDWKTIVARYTLPLLREIAT